MQMSEVEMEGRKGKRRHGLEGVCLRGEFGRFEPEDDMEVDVEAQVDGGPGTQLQGLHARDVD